MSASIVIPILLVLFAGIILIGRMVVNRNLTSYTAEQVRQRIGGKNTGLLLDVRSEAEREVSSIPNSLHIPLSDLASRIDELEEYRDREIICVCASGIRSAAAADQLGKKGFTAATMKGGMSKW